MIPTRHSQAAVFAALLALLAAGFANLWSGGFAEGLGPGPLALAVAFLATTAALAFVNSPGLAVHAPLYFLAAALLALLAGLVVGAGASIAACAVASLILGDLAWAWSRPRVATG